MIRYPQNYKTKMDQNNFKELFLVDKIQMWFNPQEDLWDAVLFQTVPVKTLVSLKTGPALYFALVSCIYNTTSVQQRKCLTIKFKCTQFYSWKCMSNNKRDKKKTWVVKQKTSCSTLKITQAVLYMCRNHDLAFTNSWQTFYWNFLLWVWAGWALYSYISQNSMLTH